MISAKIKMLEWHNFDAWTHWAEGACGTYHVEERNGYWQVELRVGGLVHGVTQTDDTTPADLDAAKAAAQADYEARIIAALEPAPVTLAEAAKVQALVDALRSTLNFIQNTESEMGVILGCGDKARAALAAWKDATK